MYLKLYHIVPGNHDFEVTVEVTGTHNLMVGVVRRIPNPQSEGPSIVHACACRVLDVQSYLYQGAILCSLSYCSIIL
jgi:hypothetical protein